MLTALAWLALWLSASGAAASLVGTWLRHRAGWAQLENDHNADIRD